jgi:hypothetical protein
MTWPLVFNWFSHVHDIAYWCQGDVINCYHGEIIIRHHGVLMGWHLLFDIFLMWYKLGQADVIQWEMCDYYSKAHHGINSWCNSCNIMWISPWGIMKWYHNIMSWWGLNETSWIHLRLDTFLTSIVNIIKGSQKNIMKFMCRWYQYQRSWLNQLLTSFLPQIECHKYHTMRSRNDVMKWCHDDIFLIYHSDLMEKYHTIKSWKYHHDIREMNPYDWLQCEVSVMLLTMRS